MSDRTSWKPLAWNAAVWPIARASPVFPEQQLDDWPPPGTSDTGVCFSGGGSRAMSAAMGQMRGLRALGLLGRARYMSCVSGGSWAGTIYTFVPASTDDSVLLGHHLQPGKITSRSVVDQPLDARTMCEPATKSLYEPLKHFWDIGVPENHLWLRTIGFRFLRPFGNGEFGLNKVTQPFTWNKSTRDAILARNGGFFSKEDFYLVEERNDQAAQRPFLIDMATLIWKPSAIWEREYLHPVEMTPYYCGVPEAYSRTYDGYDIDVGGGVVESFAFGRPLYKHQPESRSTVWTTIGRPFVLSDMTGTSSAFYAADAAEADLGRDWDPSYTYYPIPVPSAPAYGASVQLTGDGGNLDNTGILPLLLRRVPHIVSFLNSDQKTEWSDLHDVPIVADMLPPLFGYAPYSEFFGYQRYSGDSTDPWAILKVFEPDQFHPLIDRLWKAFKNGQSAMWKGDFSIAADNRLGIDYGGKKVSILWVYNNPVASWTDLIASEDVRRDVVQGQTDGTGRLPYFPNYSTGFEDVSIWNPASWKKLADLTAYQVTMLADLSHWNVTTDQASPNGPPNRAVFESMF